MGRRTETLLLQAYGTFAQELHLAFEARIFHVEMQRREHDEDAHEERDGHIDQVAVVTRKAFAHEDVARKEQPQETRLAAALHAGGALLLGTLLLLGLAVGTQVVVGLAALHAQHLAADLAGEFRLAGRGFAVGVGRWIEFGVFVAHGLPVVFNRRTQFGRAGAGIAIQLFGRRRDGLAGKKRERTFGTEIGRASCRERV